MNIAKKIYRFYSQVKQEAFRIAWPSRSETITSTWVVILAVFIFSLVCMGIDFTFRIAIQYLLNL